MTAEVSEIPVKPAKSGDENHASQEAWALMASRDGAHPTSPTSPHTPDLQITDSQSQKLNMNANGQVEFENTKGAVSCPVPQSASSEQFLFFRFSSHEKGTAEDIGAVCKEAIGQFQKLESADQAYALAGKIPDQNLRKAVELSIYENELKRAGISMTDVAFEEVMLIDTRPSSKLTPEERKARVDAQLERIKNRKARQNEDAFAPAQEMTPEEAAVNQQKLAQYLKEVGITEGAIKYNLERRVPLGWDVRQMPKVDAPEANSAGRAAEQTPDRVTKTPINTVPEGQVFVRTDIQTNGGDITTEYTAPVKQTSSQFGIGVSAFGQPIVGFGQSTWNRGADPPPEVENAIRGSLADQMDAEVWDRGQRTKHERGVENAVAKNRGMPLPHPHPQ